MTEPSRNTSSIRERIVSLLSREFGAAEEDLVAAGILDSVRSMQLLALLQTEFGIRLSNVKTADLATIDRIVALVERSPR